MPGLPDDFQKLIKKLLEAQSALDKKSSTPGEVVASFNKILQDFVGSSSIQKYIDDKTNRGANL